MTRKALLLLATLASAASARAQFSVYGMATVDHTSGIQTSPILQTLSPAPCSGTVTTGCTQYNNTVDPLGFTAGVTYDFRTFGPALLSFDVRGSETSSHRGAQANAEGTGTHIYSALGGVKASFKTRYTFLSPYGQVSAGFARSNYGVLTSAVSNGTSYPSNPVYPGIPTQNNLEYHVFAGADLRLASFMDFRAVELGYGAIQAFGTYAHTYPILSVSTGVVFHIPPR